MPSLEEVITQQKIKTGEQALRQSGMQVGFAAQMCSIARGTSPIITRAGRPPNYDKKSAAKPITNKTKTSINQGFFNGYLSATDLFSRPEQDEHGNTVLRGIDQKDKEKLALPITDPDHLTKKQLHVTLGDIAFQLSDDGDLQFNGFNKTSGELSLKFKAGKGPPGFTGDFKINLKDGKKFEQVFTRPWNAQRIDPDQQEALTKLLSGDEPLPIDLNRLQDQEFALEYREYPGALSKPAEVLAAGPKTKGQLLAILTEANDPKKDEITDSDSFQQALEKVGAATLERLYQEYSTPYTGDCDGLVLGHPNDLDPKFLEKYDTRLGPNQATQIAGLLENSLELLDKLKKQAEKKTPEERTALDKMLLQPDVMDKIADDFTLSRAGIITPYEYVYQQIANYAYKQENNPLGEPTTGLQETLDNVIAAAIKQCNDNRKESLSEPEKSGLITAAQVILAGKRKDAGIEDSTEFKAKLNRYLERTLKRALSQDFAKLKTLEKPSVKATHPDYDPNIDDLYQHGFDMNNPNGVEADGPWMMATKDGQILRGENQQALIEVLLSDDARLLNESYFPINAKIDMRANTETGRGWGDVIAKQIEIDDRLGLSRVSKATKENYQVAREIQNLEREYTGTGAKAGDDLSPEDFKTLSQIIDKKDAHKQSIEPELLLKYAKAHTEQGLRPRLQDLIAMLPKVADKQTARKNLENFQMRFTTIDDISGGPSTVSPSA